MFTGIIQAIGEVRRIERRGGDVRLHVGSPRLGMHDVRHGDSIATSGVCLTVVEWGADWYAADVSLETLGLTTLGSLAAGARVNLEKAMAAGERLGGHIVSGHVDGVGEIVSLAPDGRSIRYRVRAPQALARYIAHKGSICVDGVSLTVNGVDGAEFELNIIPVTASETIFGDYRPGTRVNLEVDVIARYLERLLLGDAAARPATGGITREFLHRNGFDAS
ncbi:MAG: Riboflavin synthase [Pseudomonadales bacterium]|nr:Riboflavin synthase [Pseudomonadales bacterium]